MKNKLNDLILRFESMFDAKITAIFVIAIGFVFAMVLFQLFIK